MKSPISKDILVAAVLLIALVVCFQSLKMPMAFVMFVHTVLVLGYIVFALFASGIIQSQRTAIVVGCPAPLCQALVGIATVGKRLGILRIQIDCTISNP